MLRISPFDALSTNAGFPSFFRNDTPYARFNAELERRIRDRPVPSLVADLKKHLAADALDKMQSLGTVTMLSTGPDGKRVQRGIVIGEGHPFASMADTYLYLGPRDLLLNETTPASTMLDKPYMDEMRRRDSLLGPSAVTSQADPDKVAKAGYGVFLYAMPNQYGW